MNPKLKGTGVAVVTPFAKEGKIDYSSLEKLIEHVISGKANYLVVLGTTGESVTLTKEEKISVIKFVKEKNRKRLPVVLGIGGNNTRELINSFNSYDFKDVDAILSVSPYYNKPSQEGIYRHYLALAAESPKPLILYNVPGRTGSNITAETTLRLAASSKNIIGIKEASGDLNQVMKIINKKPSGFLVISGDDALALPIVAAGGDGVISVVANVFPKIFSEMVMSALQNDLFNARKNHYKLLSVTEMFFSEGNPAGVKAALKIINICEDNLRLPLVNISPALQEKMKSEIAKVLR